MGEICSLKISSLLFEDGMKCMLVLSITLSTTSFKS
ncbi:hypothetical protein MICRO116_230026 [Micrococcus sp. 116]|nr:hypothetical protein MICRO116_230026 [Micrococcus sp. 116]